MEGNFRVFLLVDILWGYRTKMVFSFNIIFFSKICGPPMCNEEGIYVSNYCQQNGLDQCALMITSFPGKHLIITLFSKYINTIFLSCFTMIRYSSFIISSCTKVFQHDRVTDKANRKSWNANKHCICWRQANENRQLSRNTI